MGGFSSPVSETIDVVEKNKEKVEPEIIEDFYDKELIKLALSTRLKQIENLGNKFVFILFAIIAFDIHNINQTYNSIQYILDPFYFSILFSLPCFSLLAFAVNLYFISNKNFDLIIKARLNKHIFKKQTDISNKVNIHINKLNFLLGISTIFSAMMCAIVAYHSIQNDWIWMLIIEALIILATCWELVKALLLLYNKI